MHEFKVLDVIENELFINGTYSDSVSVHMALSLMMMKSVLRDCKTPSALTVGAAQDIPESNIPPKIVSGVFWILAVCSKVYNCILFFRR